jgi:hypothetical protein
MSWRLIGGGLALGLGASIAFAGLIPGGGSGKSDCYFELDVQGIENPSDRVQNNKVVLCTDGEACDSGPCGDDLCEMKIAACINQTDPNLPDCTPPTGLDKAKVPGAFNIEIPQVLEGSACGAFLDVDVAVKVKRNGTKTFGKAKIKGIGRGVKGTKPRKDTDNFSIRCYPRTVECPASPSGAFLD